MRIGLVTPRMRSGETGGAEALYEGLLRNLRGFGYEVDQVEVPIDESSFEAILESYVRCFELDLSSYDLVISTKAPTFMARHPNHVSYLFHTIRVFYDMFEREFGAGTPEHHRQRGLIQALDMQGLHPQRIRKHFAIAEQPFRRLWEVDPFWREVRFRALHPPPIFDAFPEPRPGQYVFLPSRLHRWKRVDLIIDAFKYLDRDIPLKISGTGEDEEMLRERAGNDPRIEFLGRTSDEELLDLYAGALVVPFVPQLEDYGFITIEAFRTQKPVITCTDSGEPTRFVRDFETGFVVEPDPRALAERLTYLVDHPIHAAEMGRAGQSSVAYISWDTVISSLVSTADSTRTPHLVESSGPELAGDGLEFAGQVSVDERCKVVVLDMQPIDPPLGGGRLRLLGLYHGLENQLEATYVGTYDWPGQPQRTLPLTASLQEVDVPLSPAHFAMADQWRQRAGGKTVIDVSFDLLAHLSPEYVNTAREHAAKADIVVCSHPWVFPLVQDQINTGRQLLVYESHNVEGLLRTTLLDDGGFGTEMAEHVATLEYEICHAAHLVLCCSHQDRVLFHELYDVPFEKLLVAPNGTFTRRLRPADDLQRIRAKQGLGLEGAPVALFIGSNFPPNVEAAEFIQLRLAPALPTATFVICGDVGAELHHPNNQGPGPTNVRITGRIDEAEKERYLAAADLAVNPMFSGSGTNIKMFDFMATGLPIVSTPTGARGIAHAGEDAFRVSEADDFAAGVRAVLANPAEARDLGAAARRTVEQLYSWERISAAVGKLLGRRQAKLGGPIPRFSVVIPTYERHEKLWEVIESLDLQGFRDFEVIVVDQSATPWEGRDRYPDLDLVYVHLDVKGAIHARNVGAFHARGEVLAFTDDDCLPLPDWLANAHRRLEDADLVGLEGLITSARRDDPDFRAVTNEGFEGMGFMTANLFVRRAVFQAIDGFDYRFDHPHFREDTDLGWRAMEHGAIPFCDDVRVYHPPHPRALEREGAAERARFFEKDALLLRKHPEKYRRLFMNEAHYLHTEGFGEHFLRGAAKYGVDLDDFYLALLRPMLAPVADRAES